MSLQEAAKTVGDNIRKIRLSKNLSQIDLAAAANMEQSKIARLENGQSNPTLKTLVILSEILEIKIEILFQPNN